MPPVEIRVRSPPVAHQEGPAEPEVDGSRVDVGLAGLAEPEVARAGVGDEGRAWPPAPRPGSAGATTVMPGIMRITPSSSVAWWEAPSAP